MSLLRLSVAHQLIRTLAVSTQTLSLRNMKNLHIEHPEDTILTGDLSVLDAFSSDNHYSVKIDGSPAIVWGTDPENGKFFVGTKSVFNKRTPKVNYSNADIERNHGHNFELSSILHRCFNCLPRIGFEGRVFQGDFIGFGGYRDYKPNAISYTFAEVQNVGVVVAPHTEYTGETMKTMTAAPLMEKLGEGFIQPNAWISDLGSDIDIDLAIAFAHQIATMVDFATEKEAKQLKQDLNAYIRDGDEVVAEEFANYQLVRLWLLVKRIKTNFLQRMRDDFDAECFLGNEYISGEGM